MLTVESYLVLFELPVDQQGGLLVHFLSHSVGDSIVRLQASVETGVAVLVVHILLGVPERGEVGRREETGSWTRGKATMVKLRNQVILVTYSMM